MAAIVGWDAQESAAHPNVARWSMTADVFGSSVLMGSPFTVYADRCPSPPR